MGQASKLTRKETSGLAWWNLPLGFYGVWTWYVCDDVR